jgi:hypothetical protein
MAKIYDPLSYSPKGVIWGIGHFIIRARIAWKILSKPKAHFFIVTLSEEALEAQFTGEDALVDIETHRLQMYNVRLACSSISSDFDVESEFREFDAAMREHVENQSKPLPKIRFKWPWRKRD